MIVVTRPQANWIAGDSASTCREQGCPGYRGRPVKTGTRGPRQDRGRDRLTGRSSCHTAGTYRCGERSWSILPRSSTTTMLSRTCAPRAPASRQLRARACNESSISQCWEGTSPPYALAETCSAQTCAARKGWFRASHSSLTHLLHYLCF